jgi:hypothetical protein
MPSPNKESIFQLDDDDYVDIFELLSWDLPCFKPARAKKPAPVTLYGPRKR